MPVPRPTGGTPAKAESLEEVEQRLQPGSVKHAIFQVRQSAPESILHLFQKLLPCYSTCCITTVKTCDLHIGMRVLQCGHHFEVMSEHSLVISAVCLLLQLCVSLTCVHHCSSDISVHKLTGWLAPPNPPTQARVQPTHSHPPYSLGCSRAGWDQQIRAVQCLLHHAIMQCISS